MILACEGFENVYSSSMMMLESMEYYHSCPLSYILQSNTAETFHEWKYISLIFDMLPQRCYIDLLL